MARWAIVTVVLYLVVVVVLAIPGVCWLMDKATGHNDADFLFGIEALGSVRQAWLVLAMVLLAQLLMLIFPVRMYSDNPVPQRAIWVPVLTTCILLFVLLAGMSGSLVAAIWGDHPDSLAYGLWIGVGVLASWAIWAVVFYAFGKAQDMPGFAQRLARWLVKGSIVELLVAVPCHIIVRHRNDCCAPGVTFFGISAGLAVMAIAFGPSVLILVNNRVGQMRSRRQRMV